MTNNEREQIRAFLSVLLARKLDNAGFTDDDSLLFSGRLDSLNVLEIAAFLEKTFGFDLSAREFDKNAFDSVDSLLAYLHGE